MLVNGLNFGQLVIWLKNSYFGENTQSLGRLCLWQCQYQCNDLKRQNTFRNISKNFVLSLQIAFNSKAVMTMSISFCRRGNWGLSTRVTQALDDLVIIFLELFCHCPGQLDRWPCQWLSRCSFDFSVFRALQSCCRHVWVGGELNDPKLPKTKKS